MSLPSCSLYKNWHWPDYIVYDVWLFVELIVVYSLFVETYGASVEETAAILDGAAVQEQLIEGVARATDLEKKLFVNGKADSELNTDHRRVQE
jgi:hypothetical protein